MSAEAPREPLDNRIRLAVGGPAGHPVVFQEPAYPSPDPDFLMVPGENLLRHLIHIARGGRKPWLYIQASDLETTTEPPELRPYSFCNGEITVDPRRLKIYKQDAPVRLSPQLYRMAAFLGRSPGEYFTAAELLKELWDRNADEAGPLNAVTLRGHVRALRQKLGREAILSGHRTGYAARPN